MGPCQPLLQAHLPASLWAAAGSGFTVLVSPLGPNSLRAQGQHALAPSLCWASIQGPLCVRPGWDTSVNFMELMVQTER